VAEQRQDRSERSDGREDPFEGRGDPSVALGALGPRGVLGAIGGLLLASASRRVFRRPRVRRRRMRALGLGLLIAVLSVTTCSFGLDPATLTESYGPPVPSSAQDAIDFAEKGARAIERFGADNTLRITVTESEATSALSLGLLLPELMTALNQIPPDELKNATDLETLRERVWREQDQARDSLLAGLPLPARLLEKLDPRIRTGDVQVRFQESGEVVVGGFVQAWSFRQPLMFVVAPRARSGELDLDFVKGRLGRLPAPTFLFDPFGDVLARGVLLGREYAEVTDLTVGAGSLTFGGRLGI